MTNSIAMSTLPLLKGFKSNDIICWHGADPISCQRFLSDVVQLAERLPDKAYVFNLLNGRYHFFVGFSAVLVRGQINLLPPNQLPKVVFELTERYPNSYVLTDQLEQLSGLELFHYIENTGEERKNISVPDIKAEHTAAIVFTSGSTGRPMAYPKTWASLVVGADMARPYLWGEGRPAINVVATVPPQHMYGLEATIIHPMQSGYATHSGRPFYPEDVHKALAQVPMPRVLVTTPLHIRACVTALQSWPEVKFILSATAPLSYQTAKQAEKIFNTKVLEIYGCTETGAIASRRTIEGDLWRIYDGINLQYRGDVCFADVPELDEPVGLADIIQLRNTREFNLHGRISDLIKIAGKRISMGNLNHKLNEIKGVLDGVFFMPDEVAGKVNRLIAFVVAPNISKQNILDELRLSIDPVFLPRPLYLVDALPRTENNKLPRSHLLDLFNRYDNKHMEN